MGRPGAETEALLDWGLTLYCTAPLTKEHGLHVRVLGVADTLDLDAVNGLTDLVELLLRKLDVARVDGLLDALRVGLRKEAARSVSRVGPPSRVDRARGEARRGSEARGRTEPGRGMAPCERTQAIES